MKFLVVIEGEEVDRVLFMVEDKPTADEEAEMLAVAGEAGNMGEEFEIIATIPIEDEGDLRAEHFSTSRPYVG